VELLDGLKPVFVLESEGDFLVDDRLVLAVLGHAEGCDEVGFVPLPVPAEEGEGDLVGAIAVPVHVERLEFPEDGLELVAGEVEAVFEVLGSQVYSFRELAVIDEFIHPRLI